MFPSLYSGPKKAIHSYSWQMLTGLASEGMMPPFRPISLSGWSRGPELSRLLEGPCHSDWLHKHKRPRCNCHTSVFVVYAGEASVHRPAVDLVLNYVGVCSGWCAPRDTCGSMSSCKYDGGCSRAILDLSRVNSGRIGEKRKIWIVQFQSQLWKGSASERNSGKIWKHFRVFCPL